MSELKEIEQNAIDAVASADSITELEQVRVEQLGKKGIISAQLQMLGKLPPEERKEFGQSVNQVKVAVSEAIEIKKFELEALELDKKLATEKVDVTLPVRPESKVGFILYRK